jgi:hypothetical protein
MSLSLFTLAALYYLMIWLIICSRVCYQKNLQAISIIFTPVQKDLFLTFLEFIVASASTFIFMVGNEI